MGFNNARRQSTKGATASSSVTPYVLGSFMRSEVVGYPTRHLPPEDSFQDVAISLYILNDVGKRL
jgi:hypothetical protein